MRKKVLVISMLTITLLSMLLIPTTLSKKNLECPIYVEGDWLYTPRILERRDCEDDVILRTEEEGTFTGGFEGTSYDYPCTVVVHNAVLDASGNIIGFDSRYYTGIVNYEGMVNGKSGRLKMIVVGKQMWGEEWQGTWRIVKGYGWLAHVEGFGTWWGPGFVPGVIEPGKIEYEGWIH